MANVVKRDGADRSAEMDRAQLILVAGLTIAVILVVLVLLLNTVIYTENLATRGVDVGGGDAIEYRWSVITGVGGLLDEENQRAGGFNETALRNGINATGDVLSDRYLQRGVIAEINRSSVDFDEGYLVVQDENRTFESANESLDPGDPWRVASGVENTRQFSMDIEPLHNGTDGSSGFYLNLSEDGGSGLWIVYVYIDDTSGNLTVETESPAESPTIKCSINETSATLDLSAGTINGESCSDWTWADTIDSPYSIQYVNGDQANGTYSLTVDGEPDEDNLNDTSGDAPYFVTAAYSATMEVRYESSDLRFVTQVRVAPGEPDA